MGNISKENALEAYNLIREYCRQNVDCENCLFVYENCSDCIFDEGQTLIYPMNWQSLELH